LQTQTDAFIADNYRVRSLLRRIVMSPAFYVPAAAAPEATPDKPAAKPAITASTLHQESR
jgi:hypothetical protein